MEKNIEYGRNDLRWLDSQGNEVSERPKGSYLFRSDVTDAAQKAIEEKGFDGMYVRHLSTGRCETEYISLAMLSLAQQHNGIVGVTLEGLIKNPLASSLIRLPEGRVLSELVEASYVFKLSAEEGIELPDFSEYSGADVFSGSWGNMKYQPNKENKTQDRRSRNIASEIYVEFQPEFVERLGSVDLRFGPMGMDNIREHAKTQAPEYKLPRQSILDVLRKTIGQ